MSKRKDFEEALVEYLTKMMYWVAEQRGGVNEILNDLFLTEDNPEFSSDEMYDIIGRKRFIDKKISSERIGVSIKKVTLNTSLQPEWTYWIKFWFDEDAHLAWNIDDMTVILTADKSYRVLHYAIGDINEKRVRPKVNDPLWDYFKTLVNGETFIKITNFSK